MTRPAAEIGRWLRPVAAGLALAWVGAGASGGEPLAPHWLAGPGRAGEIFVAGESGRKLLAVEPGEGKVLWEVELPGEGRGLALAGDGETLYVACGGPDGAIAEVRAGRVVRTLAAGHTPMAPVPAAGGRILVYAAHFEDAVVALELETGRELWRTAARRQPVALALSADGESLLVANHLPAGRADRPGMAATVQILRVRDGEQMKELQLPAGAGSLKDVRVAPDGRWAVVTHLLARYHLPTTQVERGWINANAMTLIDTGSWEVKETVLLDGPERGAANPWGTGWSEDGRWLAVAHAGTSEVSVIDWPDLLAKLQRAWREGGMTGGEPEGYLATPVGEDLTFLAGLRRRLPTGGETGPRAVLWAGGTLWAAHFFSDSLTWWEGARMERGGETVRLGREPVMTPERQGEMYFHDARLSLQGWQSCASCHPGKARVDGFNWDLMNDGVGNPKNNRSLLYSHQTVPVMSMGVRDRAETAVRAGFRHAHFLWQKEEVAAAVDAYLRSLRPVPSPWLVEGRLGKAAERGRALFEDARVGCAECHPGDLGTDMKAHNVGTLGELDRPGDLFYTPVLVELWRTAPYLHDGSCAEMREMLTTRNRENQHGYTSHLGPGEIDDLVAYLLSL